MAPEALLGLLTSKIRIFRIMFKAFLTNYRIRKQKRISQNNKTTTKMMMMTASI
jgi:hypothetical protein